MTTITNYLLVLIMAGFQLSHHCQLWLDRSYSLFFRAGKTVWRNL